MQNLLKDFEQHLQKKHLSRATVRNYKTDLKLFLNWCGACYGSLSPEEIKPHLFDEYINKLVRENRTASSIKRYKISLYKFFEWTQPHYQAPPRVAFQKVALPAVVPAPTPGRTRPRLPLKYAAPVLLAALCLFVLGFRSYNNYVQPLRTYFDDLTTELTTERGFSKIVKRGLTLAEEAVRGVLEINVPVEMNQGLTASTVTADTVTAGNLTYTVAAGNAIDITGGQNPVISIADDSLDFTELKDLLTLDNSTEIALGSSNLTFSGSGTISLPAGQIDNAELANSTINLAGDSGSSAIALGGTITVTGGEGIDTSESSGTLSVSIAATAVTAGSYGSSTAVPTFTVDADGRLTAAGMTTLSAGVIAADTLDFSEFKDAMQLDASTTIDLNSKNLSFWNTGNVGIGTTSPGAKLDVGGTLTASGTVTFSGLVAGTDNSVIVLNSTNQLVTDEIDSRVWGATLMDYSGSSANYLAKFSDADTLTNSVLYETSGNLGIGTTSPSYKLDVSGAGRFTSGLTASNIRVGVSGSGEIDTTSGNLTLDSAGGTVTVDDHLKLLDDMELQLGTNPDVRFLWETADADNHYLSTALSGSLNWIVSADNGVDWNRSAGSNPTLFIQSADETSPNEYLSLSHDGTDAQIAVGSGGLTTTAASFTLTNGTTNFVAINSSGAITLQPTAGQDLSITTSGTGDFAVNTNQFFIDASEGKVGIGTTSPDTKLHIVGDAYIASDSGYSFDNPSSSSDLYVEGNLEVEGSLFVDASTTFTGTQVKLNDDVELQLGSSSDARFVWETADADSHYLSTVLTNNMNWIISADNNTDWGRAAASNPTVYIQSADETSVNDYLALYHDQTNALITSGSGNIVLTPAGNVVLTSGKELYSFGSATLGNRTYTQDNYVTDAQTFTGSIEALDLGLAAVAGGAAGLWQDNTTYIYASNVSSGDVVVADNGNMGIGTTIPSYKLDVRGTINITGATTLNGVAYTWPGSDAASSGRALTSDGAGTLGWTDLTGSGSGDVGAWTVSGNDLYPDSTAYHVGIGNTGPAYTLDVTGTGRFTVGGYIDAVQIGISSAGEIDTTSGNLTIDSAGGTVTIDDILAVASTASFSGNVNLTDDVELQFGGSSDVRFLWETADIDNHYLSTVLSGSMNWIVSADNSIDWGRTAATNPTIFIQSADSDSKSEYLSLSHNGTDAVINVGSGKMHLAIAGGNKLTVDTGGNVGIGTTAPDALLHTVGGDVYVAPDSGYTFNNTSANEDLYVFGNLEVDGTIHGDVSGDISGGLNPGFTQGSVVFMGAAGLAEDNANFFWNDTSNYLGLGTTGPGAKLEVVGQCVTGDTKLRRRKRRKTEDGKWVDEWENIEIKDIKPGDEIQTLDEATGKLVVAKVKALMDMGTKAIFKMTTASGKTIRTTGNHPYLVKTGKDTKPKVGVFYDDSNMYFGAQDNKWKINPKKLYKLLANSFNLQFFNYYIATPDKSDHSYPGTQKYLKNLGKAINIKQKPLKYIPVEGGHTQKKGDIDIDLAMDVVRTVDDLDLVIVVSGDSDYLALADWIEKDKGKQIAFIGYRRNMAWELWEKQHLFVEKIRNMVDLRALPAGRQAKKNPKFYLGVTLLSYLYHNITSLSSGKWQKVTSIRKGDQIAVAGRLPAGKAGFDKAVWDKVVKIEKLPAEQVYDIEVEGTHNFIGNDIVAHNTYISGASAALGVGYAPSTFATGTAAAFNGNLGIGTTSPTALLHLSVGSTTVVGQKITLASGATANAFEINSTAGASGDKFLVTAGGNVGIGTTSPTAMLDVHGTIENGLVGWWPLDGDATDKSIGGHNGTMTNSACPANYVLVPGNATYGTSDFCVMQYEAKSVGGVATSQADVTPWASISQTNAAAACITAGGHLITNNEWMTIARNAEAVASNWGNGVPNSTVASGGGLKRGNVGQTDSASCDEANPAFGSGRNSKSMLTLSNGQTIWDFSGNVWEWTNDSITCAADSCTAAEMPYDAVPGEEWVEFPLLAGYGSLTYDKIRPIGTSLNSLYGVGQIYTDNTIASPSGRVHAFIRGGTWYDGAYAGAFTLALDIAPAGTGTDLGFRCVR